LLRCARNDKGELMPSLFDMFRRACRTVVKQYL
jgi:hypothetical protein